jgi:hypothetical protein
VPRIAFAGEKSSREVEAESGSAEFLPCGQTAMGVNGKREK